MAKIDRTHIRNFSIVAHIDHGKSTLADRLMERTGTVTVREMKEQLLDDMELERARGITIKARAVSMLFEHEGETYELNLVDTPGHVDFQYEVSRSLACCEGAVLLVDAFQGVEAQTVANAYSAMEHSLTIVPVMNKIDLTHARPEEVKEEMEQSLGIDPGEVLACSAKSGIGTDDVLHAIIDRVPPPDGDAAAPLQAMVFDSHYDEFRGAITYVRVVNGTVKKGQKIVFLSTGSSHEVMELGQFAPGRRACDELRAGQVGYLICNIKSLGQVHIGDTISVTGDGAGEPLPGYQEPKRMVFCGLYPSDGQDFEDSRDALNKLAINDPSFEFEAETSDALGFGFRCGFLGLLHMEIIQQRLEQEADIDLVQTAPNVTYEIETKTGKTLEIHTPQKVPEGGEIEEFRQPVVRVSFVLPTEFIGPVMKLCTERRGVYIRTEYLSPTRAMVVYDLALAEVIYDLHDKLKSSTRGYGTMDYELQGYFPADLVRLDILVGGNRIDALSIICDRRDADRRGRAVVKKLRTEIDRHMFEVAVQAAIGTRIIARETISAMRKNVTAKCYGGDISRKRKLWQKQKEGKKRMKSIGRVDIPQKAFLAVLETGQEESERLTAALPRRRHTVMQPELSGDLLSRTRAVRWCLRVVVAVQCLGLARWAIAYDTPIFKLLWSQPDAGGFGWSESAAILVDHTAAWLLVVAACLTLVRPCWPVLIPVAIWSFAVAAAGTWMGGAFLSILSIPAHAVRILAPLALVYVDPWPAREKVSSKRLEVAMWILRGGVALTFIVHGWEAVAQNPIFLDYLIGAGDQLLGLDVSQAAAATTLWMIGIVDILLGVLIVCTRWRHVALYMAFWGFVTAACRIVHGGWDQYHETLVRAANGGVPLAIFLYWWDRSHIVHSRPASIAKRDHNEPTDQDSTS